MRYAVTAAMLVAALAAVPVGGVAATPQRAQATAKAPAKAMAATHATSGIVRSIDTGTLVITRSGKKGGEMTFALNPSTHREGTVEVASPVSVRYRTEGKAFIATAITVEHVKQQAAAHKAPSVR
jgi:hypothetical protein